MSKKTVIRIKKSVVVLGGSELLAEIERFDLSNATPTDCFEFIRELKDRYGNR